MPNSAGAGRWAAMLGLAGLAAGAIAGWTWYSRRITTSAQAGVAVPEVQQVSTAPAPPATGREAQEIVARLTERAPELNHRSAQMLVASSASLSVDSLAESALVLATGGFEALSPSQLKELGDLFKRVYAEMASVDREWMSTYIDRVRGGALTPDESRRGRTLLTQGVQKLPEAKRLRLQILMSEAIEAGLKRRSGAEAQQREAVLLAAQNEAAGQPAADQTLAAPDVSGESRPGSVVPDPREGAPESPSPARLVDTSTEKRESYWRARAARLRAALASAEAELARAEKGTGSPPHGDYKIGGCKPGRLLMADGTLGPMVDNCPKGDAHDRYVASQGRLSAAQLAVQNARQALADLEDEARRAFVPPGWLR